MKKKLFSRILCSALTVMTVVSAGMIYSSAANTGNTPYDFFISGGGYGHDGNPRFKQDDSDIYMFCSSNNAEWYVWADVQSPLDGQWYQETGSQLVNRTYIDHFLPVYYSHNKCNYVRLVGYSGTDNTVQGQWSPDSYR